MSFTCSCHSSLFSLHILITFSRSHPVGNLINEILALLFALYSSSVSAIDQSHGVQKQQHADDNQPYIALTALDLSPQLGAIRSSLASLQSTGFWLLCLLWLTIQKTLLVYRQLKSC